jgi:hypothetical protein
MCFTDGKLVRDETGLVAAEARVPKDAREIVAAWNLVERALERCPGLARPVASAEAPNHEALSKR